MYSLCIELHGLPWQNATAHQWVYIMVDLGVVGLGQIMLGKIDSVTLDRL